MISDQMAACSNTPRAARACRLRRGGPEKRAPYSSTLRREIIERAAVILQIEHAIALLKIEIRAVQLIAMAQAAGKIALHQLCLPDLCLDV
jgi:hypothetical protein